MFKTMSLIFVVYFTVVFAIQAVESEKKLKEPRGKTLFQGGRVLSNSQKAELIMKEAHKSYGVYHSLYTTSLENGEKLEQEVWKKNYPDGTYAVRVETKQTSKDGKHLLKRVDLRQTDSSFWTIIDNKAFKNKEMTASSVSGNKKERAIKKFLKYSFEDVEYLGMPCYKVTVIYPPHKKINNIIKHVFFIGKDDFFIYKDKEYTSHGVVDDFEPQKVEKLKSSVIDDAIFQIPKKCSVVIVDSERKFKFILKSIKDNTLSPDLDDAIRKKLNRTSCCGN
jgi:hypothetical protein